MVINRPLWHAANVVPAHVDELVHTLDLPPRVARWLVARQIHSVDEARRFLFAHEQLSNPFDFHEMRTAVDRIWRAIKDGERIVIVGDYDVDGVTATTILASELALHQASWSALIPERVADGYGLSPTLVDRARALDAKLLITVDNGIRADEAIHRAKQLDIDVIVTDHHEPGDTVLPPCEAIVHWSRHERPDDAMLLSGAGVAWKLATALRHGREHTLPPSSDHAEWIAGLAALGAISDMMPMRGENRRIVREGLAMLRRCRRPGWLALCERARVEPTELSVASISWRIGPRINAAGRMANADLALQLLLADKRNGAVQLADEMESLNTQRQKSTEEAVQEALALVEAAHENVAPTGIVVAGKWPLGVVGIVAAKLMNRYHCPAIVLSDMGDTILRGSGRAPDGISLHDALVQCSDTLHHFGGHDAAVGCGVEREQIDAFRAMLVETLRTLPTDKPDDLPILADDYLPLEEVTVETLDWIQRFAPHGPDNEPLQFFVGPVQVVKVTPMGAEGAHVRLRLQEGKTQLDAIWFQAPDVAKTVYDPEERYGFVVEIEENLWQGRRSVQMRITQGYRLQRPVVREAFADLYRMLRRSQTIAEADVSRFDHLAIEDVQVIFDTFVELGFAAQRNGAYHVIETVKPRDLREAIAYQMHLRGNLQAWV